MQKVIKIDKDQIIADAIVVVETTKYPEVRQFMESVMKKVKSRGFYECIELNGEVYPDHCSFCDSEIGELASVNEALPGKIFCGEACEANCFAGLSKIINIKGVEKCLLN